VKIKGEKTEARACKQQGKQGDVALRRTDNGGQNKTERGNHGNAASKSVQAVNQVDGVGNADDPKNGQRYADPRGEGVVFTHNQERIDSCSRENGEQGRKDLTDQLFPRGKIAGVVDNTDDDHNQHTNEKPEDADINIFQKQNHGGTERNENGKSADEGDGFFVHSSFIFGNIYGADLKCQNANGRGQSKCQKNAEQKGKKAVDQIVCRQSG